METCLRLKGNLFPGRGGSTIDRSVQVHSGPQGERSTDRDVRRGRALRGRLRGILPVSFRGRALRRSPERHTSCVVQGSRP